MSLKSTATLPLAILLSVCCAFPQTVGVAGPAPPSAPAATAAAKALAPVGPGPAASVASPPLAATSVPVNPSRPSTARATELAAPPARTARPRPLRRHWLRYTIVFVATALAVIAVWAYIHNHHTLPACHYYKIDPC